MRMKFSLVVIGIVVSFVCQAGFGSDGVLAKNERLEIKSVKLPGNTVGKYEKYEVDLDVTGSWVNPFDPEEIDIIAHFTSPSGKAISLPAFYCQPCAVKPVSRMQKVKLLALSINKNLLPKDSDIEFYFDDVCIESSDGKKLVLDDMEEDNSARVKAEGTEICSKLAHGGKSSLKFQPLKNKSAWPGLSWRYNEVNWSDYEKVSFWIYPKAEKLGGKFSLCIDDAGYGRTRYVAWDIEGCLKPNMWNHFEWNFSDNRWAISSESSGKPMWKVRFAPTELGQYSFYVTARDKTGKVQSDVYKFKSIPSDNPGFVRVSKKDPHYFEYDNGKAFFTIGHDVSFAIEDAVEIFPKMQAAGENCTYFIMCPDIWWQQVGCNSGIEGEKLGYYTQKNAAATDWYIDWAKKHGIYLKLSFDVHGDFNPAVRWEKNPYNIANGGPCKTPNDFYTCREAMKFYKNKVRYIIARWAYSTNIMGWEYIAEIDNALEGGWAYPVMDKSGKISAMLVSWLKEMNKVIACTDPYNHLITESFSNETTDDNMWMLGEIGYIQFHDYNPPDIAKALNKTSLELTKKYSKPVHITEFGWMVTPIEDSIDRNGICLHNGIWSSMASNCAGTAMSWWWGRIHRLNLYYHFKAIAEFAKDIGWTEEGFKPVEAKVNMSGASHRYDDVLVYARGPFGKLSVTKIKIDNKGCVNYFEMPRVLFASKRNEFYEPEFEVNYPKAGKFIVHVDTVSPDALLEIYLDDKLVMHKELPSENVKGKKCVFVEKWKIWSCEYDEEFSIDVPKGRHIIKLRNAKNNSSWISLKSYTLTNYMPVGVRAFGLAGGTMTFLWVQNESSTWWNEKQGIPPVPIGGTTINLPVTKDGIYSVQWWDTYKGVPEKTEKVKANGKELEITVPLLKRDIACKIRLVEKFE